MKISNAILGFLAVVCCILQTNAQSSSDTETKNYDQGFRLGFGVNGGYIFQEPYHFSYGGDVRLQYDLSKRYSITLTGGYTNFTISGSKNHLAFIPVRAGYKTFIWENKFYAMGEFGAAFGVTDAYRKTSAAICPSVGYIWGDFLDISLRYESYADFPNLKDNGVIGDGVGLFSVRLAYGFRL